MSLYLVASLLAHDDYDWLHDQAVCTLREIEMDADDRDHVRLIIQHQTKSELIRRQMKRKLMQTSRKRQMELELELENAIETCSCAVLARAGVPS